MPLLYLSPCAAASWDQGARVRYAVRIGGIIVCWRIRRGARLGIGVDARLDGRRGCVRRGCHSHGCGDAAVGGRRGAWRRVASPQRALTAPPVLLNPTQPNSAQRATARLASASRRARHEPDREAFGRQQREVAPDTKAECDCCDTASGLHDLVPSPELPPGCGAARQPIVGARGMAGEADAKMAVRRRMMAKKMAPGAADGCAIVGRRTANQERTRREPPHRHRRGRARDPRQLRRRAAQAGLRSRRSRRTARMRSPAFRTRLPDLALIDIGLADDVDGGFALCRELRALSPTVPIIFLSARDSGFRRRRRVCGSAPTTTSPRT